MLKLELQYFGHLIEFQRIAGERDKKAFLSDQCKETEENNRMGKTRDLFKKIRDTKGTFHAKMGSLKDRNGMDLTQRFPASSVLAREGAGCRSVGDVTGAGLASAPLWPSLWT